MASSRTSAFTLKVTEEQAHAIEALFKRNGWTYNSKVVETLPGPIPRKRAKKKIKQEAIKSPGGSTDTKQPKLLPIPNDQQQAQTDDILQEIMKSTGVFSTSKQSTGLEKKQVQTGSECEHCFLTPCVSIFKYDFHGPGQPPCSANPGMRRMIYRKYWQVMSNRDGWIKPQYLAHKANISGNEGVLRIKKEIMPLCILQKARNLYPNRPGEAYMDHRY